MADVLEREREHCETKVSFSQNAILRQAFLSERAAADFMSGYGRNPRLVARVHEIGTTINELAIARANYLTKTREVDSLIHQLARHLPHGPHIESIVRKIRAVDPTCDLQPQTFSKQIPNRPLPRPSSPRGSEAATSPTLSVGPQQSQLVAENSRNPPPHTATSGRGPIIQSYRTSAYQPRRRYQPCRLCGRMGHLQTQCNRYHCVHCKTSAPGHFAKFCPRNPYQGIDRRDLPSSALAVLQSKEGVNTTPATSANRTPLQPAVPTTPNTTTKPGQLSVHNVTAHNASEHTPSRPKVTVALGPTFKPNFTPRKTASGATNVGKLQQLSHTPSNHHSGGNRTNLRTSSKLTPHYRPSLPASYDGNYEYDFDDVELYNIVGEGHLN